MFFSQAKCRPASLPGAVIGVHARLAGISLAELMTAIAVLAILSGLALQSYSGVRESAQEGAARDTVAILNRALLHFNQANWDIVLTAVPGSTSDELAVLRTLKWRDPVPARATPGSPYLPAGLSETVSSSQDDFRIRWNGNTFELLKPGISGSGLKTGSATPDAASTSTFPVDYQPLGPAQHE